MIAEVIRLKTGSGCPRENFIPIFTRMRYKIVRDGLMKYTPCPAVILLCKVAVNLKRLYAYQDGCYWLAQQPAFLVWVSFSHCADRSTVPPCLSGGFAPHFTRGFGQLWAVSLCLFLFVPQPVKTSKPFSCPSSAIPATTFANAAAMSMQAKGFLSHRAAKWRASSMEPV